MPVDRARVPTVGDVSSKVRSRHVDLAAKKSPSVDARVMSAGRRREASQGEGIEGDSDSTLLASSSITASFRLWIYPIRTYKPHLCAKPACLCRNPKQSSLNRSRPPKTRNMKATNTTANSPQLRSECGGIWIMPVAALHYTNVSHITSRPLIYAQKNSSSSPWCGVPGPCMG